MLPWPPDSGGRQDPYYQLREVSKLGHDVDLASIYVTENPPEQPAELKELVGNIFFIPGNLEPVTKQLLSNLADSIPFKFNKYYSDEGVEELQRVLIEGEPYDAIVAFQFHLSPLLFEVRHQMRTKNLQVPLLVMRAANIESKIVDEYTSRITNPLVKVFAGREAVKMKNYEAAILGEFDLVAAISPVDQAYFEKEATREPKIATITAGVDLESLTPAGKEPVPGEVVFVGSFDWHPNVDGAVWLIEKVWERVVSKYPDAHLSLVGRTPPPYLGKMCTGTISATGRVESVEEYLINASCIVVPLWIGSGMRLKILEAFAYSRPVVSTTLGAEGIEAEDGVHIFLRDDPEEFADSIVEILNDRELARKIGSNGRKLVEERYSWSKIAADLIKSIEATANT
jgi:glycosyltransferase involved in cell wall biosynthesis